MIELKVVIDKDQIKELFEETDVKMTKKKLEELEDMVDFNIYELVAELEEKLKESLVEMIQDEWGE